MFRLVGVSPLVHAPREMDELHGRVLQVRNVGLRDRKRIGVMCSASRNPGRQRKDNYWAKDLNTDRRPRSQRPTRQVVKPVKLPKKKKTPRSANVSGFPSVEYVATLQEEEMVPSPLWNTFASNVQGVWSGVGAAFSPHTAKAEPLSLEDSGDCRIVSFVELDGDRKVINRTTLWNIKILTPGEVTNLLANSLKSGSRKKKKDDDEDDDDDDEVEDEQELPTGGQGKRVKLEGDQKLISEDDDELSSDLEDEDFSGLSDESEFEEFDNDSDSEDEWLAEAGSDHDAESDDDEFVNGRTQEEEARPADVSAQLSDLDDLDDENQSVMTSTYSYEGMESVLEKVPMAEEPGLVFFEDGTYSFGPVRLVKPKDETRSYYNQPTYKIEQCLVKAGHKRVRIVHTITVNDQTEEVEVLRVAAYEEEWVSPVNTEGLRETKTTEPDLFSQRERAQPKDITGLWKVFEVSAEEQENPRDESETRIYACKEFKQRKKPPSASINEDRGTVLWLPGGIYTYVELTKSGFLRIGAGWNVQQNMNLVIERDFDSDGRLCKVRTQTEIRQPKNSS